MPKKYISSVLCEATSTCGKKRIKRTVVRYDLSINEVVSKVLRERERDMHDLADFVGQELRLSDALGLDYRVVISEKD